MKIAFKIILLLFFSFQVKAQLGKEAWHWEFGSRCALNFGSGGSTSASSEYTNEGCASISSPNTGQLLFYTDGNTAWNRNNQQMPNGTGMIGGGGTTTQAALIIPKPCSSGIYYLISADEGGSVGMVHANRGVHYSIVDMSLNGGLGDIDTSSKNILLTPPPTTEKLVGVKNTNGVDYWIITHPFLSNNFNAYIVTSAGINLTPVVSSVGTVENNISDSCLETVGYLKASPNGKKLALALLYTYNMIELYDFDASTGLVSNPITIPVDSGAYGLSFSPDNTKLYASTRHNILQFDLSSGVASSIIASQSVIASGNVITIGALQIAPDGKIYFSTNNYYTFYISAINNPNALGAACNFQTNAGSYTYPVAPGIGLPNFIDGGVFITNPLLTTNNLLDTTVCAGSSVTLNAGSNFSKYIWSTGDTTETIKINNPGIYSVKCKLDSAQEDSSQCFFGYETFKVADKPYPKVSLGNDIGFCTGNIKLSVPYGNTSYLWNTGQTNNSINVPNAGTYWVTVNLNGCISSDTINIYTDTAQLHIIYPNIITPNGDNINDYIIFGNDLFNSLHIEIYNRWGKRIFISDDPECIWEPDEDLIVGDKTLDDGTLYYIAQYSISCGGETENKTIKGFITVMK